MRTFDRFYLLAAIAGLVITEAFTGPSALQAVPRVSTKLLMKAKPEDFTSKSSASSSSLQGFPSQATRNQSPLFSSAAAGGMGSVSAPLKRGLLGFRGGSAGIAVTKFAKSILDDVASSKTKSWAVLFVSVLIETIASTLSKRARDTANPKLFAFSLCLNFISLCGFCTCLAKLDVGVAYACWAATGTVVVTAFGVLFFKEAMDPLKLVSILLVILGVVGLNLGDQN